MIRRPPRSTHCISSAASDVYKRQINAEYMGGAEYKYFVESVLAPYDNQYAIENNGGQFFSLTAYNSPPATSPLVQISQVPIVAPVDGGAVVTWAVKGSSSRPSHYVLYTTDQSMRTMATNVFVATGIESADGVVAATIGSLKNQPCFCWVESIVDCQEGNYSIDDNGGWGYMFWPKATGGGSDNLLDSDGDGMPDAWERQHGLNPYDFSDANIDLDGDGLTNLEEYVLGTNPRKADTDGDGIPDGFEVAIYANPLVQDSQMDTQGSGVSNLDCYILSDLTDSDRDGIRDGWELLHGLDPTNPSDANAVNPDTGLTQLQPISRSRQQRRILIRRKWMQTSLPHWGFQEGADNRGLRLT
eukprot:TRINITY_DN35164_c0_g1_i1.p1 TRINITY_DN35164_c0_g1~~TRINITY_DN35164_c0_g1_i1.p1  ORF type:complete len:358 (-),score=14.84 TRINITY_DN35164_c0_g1_i1:28-1101(-)